MDVMPFMTADKLYGQLADRPTRRQLNWPKKTNSPKLTCRMLVNRRSNFRVLTVEDSLKLVCPDDGALASSVYILKSLRYQYQVNGVHGTRRN